MSDRNPHAHNCAANWRGWPLTLTDFVPEDAPCTCGADARAEARRSERAGDRERQAA